MGENDDENHVIGGDFNTVLDPMLDKFGGKVGAHKKCREQILTMKESFDLADVRRTRNPNLRQYIWHSSSKRISSKRSQGSIIFLYQTFF